MSLVYTTKMYCKLCKGDVKIHLYSDDFNFEMTEEKHKQLTDHVDHMHWCHHHRVCAICGKLVEGEDLDLIVEKDFKIIINPRYEKWRKYPDYGLLTIHNKCLSK